MFKPMNILQQNIKRCTNITMNYHADTDTKHRRLLPKICTGKSTCCTKAYYCQVILNNNSTVLKNKTTIIIIKNHEINTDGFLNEGLCYNFDLQSFVLILLQLNNGK